MKEKITMSDRLTANITIKLNSAASSDDKMRFIDDVIMHFTEFGIIMNVGKNKQADKATFDFQIK